MTLHRTIAQYNLADHERIRAKCYHPHGTFIALPDDELDHSLLPRFAKMVELFPDSLAVQEGGRTLTYRQLDVAANRVANALLSATGPHPCAVALLFGMELEWTVATLAVWKAGKFWVALDLRHPQARLTTILDDAMAPLILTTARHAEVAGMLAGEQRQWLLVEDALANLAADEPPVTIGPESYAYLVYTSGSTGRPKGVIENHTNILHMIAERGGLVHPSNADCIALLLPPAAGGAVYNIVLALWYGAALKLFEFAEEGLKRFEDWLLAEEITGMHAGVVLRTWLPTLDGSRRFPSLRFLLLGAAPVYREHVIAFQRYLGGDCILINPYSSAEVRAVSLFAMDESTALSSQIVPVGYPPSWVSVEIWDEEGLPLPSGASGEVVIFTEYMTPGYWQQPELTAKAFGVDASGRRYYRCGDVGRLDDDGCLWILGRKDRQVKIRGHRVEPAEVKVKLLHVAGVREAAVIVHGTRDDEAYLTAYVTLLPMCQLSVAELRREIAAHLPNYMVPRQVKIMEKLPRNGYGKVDRPYLRANGLAAADAFDENVDANIEAKPEMTMNTKIRDSAILNAEQVYAQRVADSERVYTPLGSTIPFSPSEREQTLLHRWQRMVEHYGARSALEEDARTLTYAEVNVLANRIAHAILAHSLPNDLPVGLLFDVEGDMPVAMLAAWKAAKFFAWFEPRQPLARSQYIVEECGARVVVTNRKHEKLARQLWPAAGAVIVIEELALDLPVENPPITITASQPAYLIYTSGSTGMPKGTVELHGNLAQLMATREGLLHFSPEDRCAFLLFGVGIIFAVAAAWMYGGAVLPFQVKYEGLTRFSQWLINRRVTFVVGGADVRTWMLSLDGSQQFPDLRLLALSTSPSYREHWQAYQRYLPDQCLFANLYSATEFRMGAIFVMNKETTLEGRLIPAGYPISPGIVEIWDEEGRRVGAGETGETVIVSPYVAAGYWRSPELTASKFGVDSQRRRFYRTGDLGRIDEQGCLWVLGRKDSQIKIRGNRVETAEVEMALLELPHVQEAAVIHIGETDDTRKLLAFVSSRVELEGGDLRKQLAMRLPDYMVPAMTLMLQELPRNSNGKVARPLLREMATAFAENSLETGQSESVSSRETPSSTETETRVAGMVNELLGRSHIGPHDNFFDFGGHSLLAARLMLNIHRTYGVDLPPRDFFASPTVAALAASIDRALGEQKAMSPVVKHEGALGIEAVQVLRGAPTQLPVFLCLGWNGSVTVLIRYQELIRRFGDQWPLYGLVANGCSDPDRLFATVDGLVDAALFAMRQVQPHGPYLLLGECLGGKLAFELARRLDGEGEQIALLMLLDTPMIAKTATLSAPAQRWAKLQRKGRIWRERVNHHRNQVAELGWRDGARYVADRLMALLPHSLYPQSSFRPSYLAHQRYVTLLGRHVPAESFAHPASAIFTSHFQHHVHLWSARLPKLEVTIVEGKHQAYLAASGDEVAALLRKSLERI